MKVNKTTQWLVGAAILIASVGGQVKAATFTNIDIHVSISGLKSVTIVGATTYNFGVVSVAASSVSASAITVQNNSVVFIETYTITGANALAQGAGVDWALAASTGANQFALAAQFSTARPTDFNNSWSTDATTTGALTCSATRFGNGTEAEGGSNIALSANRTLWFRLKTPSSVTDATQHNITLTVSVL